MLKHWTTETDILLFSAIILTPRVVNYTLYMEKFTYPAMQVQFPVRTQPSRLCRHTQISYNCCFLPCLWLGSTWTKIMEYNPNLVSTSCHYPSLFIRFRKHKNLPYWFGLILQCIVWILNLAMLTRKTNISIFFILFYCLMFMP